MVRYPGCWKRSGLTLRVCCRMENGPARNSDGCSNCATIKTDASCRKRRGASSRTSRSPPARDMESRWPLKQFLAVFIISLVLYIAAYSAIEHRRTRHGPWTVTFTNLAGAPALVIDERRLSISNVILSFPTQPPSVTHAALVFDPPRE